ncbi:MAG: FeoA family protein [Limnochordia bacterium]|jgi:ferrous iron transport protein A
MMTRHRTLASLAVGEEALVCGIEADIETRWRLLDLGLVPGTRIQVIRQSPLGDPVLYMFRGTAMALRRTDARTVRVKSVGEE